MSAPNHNEANGSFTVTIVLDRITEPFTYDGKYKAISYDDEKDETKVLFVSGPWKDSTATLVHMGRLLLTVNMPGAYGDNLAFTVKGTNDDLQSFTLTAMAQNKGNGVGKVVVLGIEVGTEITHLRRGLGLEVFRRFRWRNLHLWRFRNHDQHADLQHDAHRRT